MLNSRRQRMAGISLVELMIGIVVGLVVLWGISSVYVNTARGSRTTTTANQLNQDMRAVMDIMVNDIRRAGFSGTSANSAANPFAAATTNPVLANLGTNRDCILYSYDATHAGSTPGAVDAGVDFFGFQLTAGGVVQTLNSTTLANTGTDCTTVGWENLTDERAITVTQLTFDTVGSRCIAFVPAVYKPSDTATFTTWTTAAGRGPACATTASNAPAGVAYPDATTHAFVETRQVNITLRARSVTDATLPEQTLTATALVRNNRVTLP